ncbi:MAG: glutathione S-transferase family protein [Paracoccaceae bacterium]
MADKPVLYGFNGSTYVRTVRMVLADKGVDYDQVPVNVLEGEPKREPHLSRHPFGKVPVLDIDGMRLLETDAICRYLEACHPEPSLVPDDVKDRATMNMAYGVIDAYGYPALIGVAGYHLFPDFLGGRDDAAYAEAMKQGETLLSLVMGWKGERTWIAGERASLADYLLAPILFYVSLTPETEHERLFAIPGVRAWWEAAQGLPNFKPTEPDLG